jgi:uncharacterized membrane protein
MFRQDVNVHPVERSVSAALGGVLLRQSYMHHSPGEVALAIPLLYRAITGHSYLYQMFGVRTAKDSKQKGLQVSEGVAVEHPITVGKSAEDLYRFWRHPQCLSQIMEDFVEVTEGSNGSTHWAIHGPLDRRLEWDTQIVEERPNELLRWKSLGTAQLSNEGSVSFHPAPGDRGTEVKLRLCFNVPGGTLGNAVAKQLTSVPHMVEEKALLRFKSLVETGEIPTLKHNPAAYKGTHVK